MKIICTQAEKEWIIDALTVSPVCPLVPLTNFCGKENCKVCTELSIEWEVTDGSGQDSEEPTLEDWTRGEYPKE